MKSYHAEDDVLELDVAVDDAVPVHLPHALRDLPHQDRGGLLREGPALGGEGEEVTIGGQLDEQVHVALVTEAVIYCDDVGVPQEELDLDLHRQLSDRLIRLLLRRPRKALLVYYLHRSHEPTRLVPHQEYFSEPTSTQLPQYLEFAEPRLMSTGPRLGTLAHGGVGLPQLGEAGGVFEVLGLALQALALLDELLAAGLGGVFAVLEGELLLEGRGDELEALLVGLQRGLLGGRVREVLVPELLRDELAAAGSFGLGAGGERGFCEEEGRREEERFIGDHNY